jgi:hypothetical protein
MRLRYRLATLVGFAAGLMVGIVPAQANLIITPIFDSSITSSANAVAIETTINSAISVFETTFSNSINVKIDFENMTSGLGESQVGFVYIQNYQQYYNALVSTNANPAAIAGLTANLGNAANNPVTGTTSIFVNSADSRAVGLSGGALCNVIGSAGNLSCDPNNSTSTAASVDGIIGVNTSTTFPPQANNGSNYYLIAVLEHEIDEVLGLGSAACGGCAASHPLPEDLYRYNANGTRSSLSVNCSSPGTAFFSYSGLTDLAQFNNACNGADFGDWQSNPLPNGTSPQVQDEFGSPGSSPVYGANEIAALSAIGYIVATPEPGTGTLLSLAFLGLGAVVLIRRRANAA